MARSSFLFTLLAASALAGEKPAISYKAPPSGEDDRPLITQIVLGAQGTDYALKIEFDKEPYGDSCGTHCANATVFLDTDNNKKTGLRLKDPKAAETGADLALTLQGTKVYRETSSKAVLKVKVRQYAEGATEVDQGREMGELDPTNDPERVLVQGTGVSLLIDANLGDLPAGAKTRVVYHPPESAALVGVVTGLTGRQVEIFRDGKLTNPVVPRKKTSQSL